MASPDRNPHSYSNGLNHPMTVTSKDLDAYPKKRILGGAAATVLGVLLMADGLRTHPNPPENIPDFMLDPKSENVSVAKLAVGEVIALAGIIVPMADIALRDKKREARCVKLIANKNI